MHCSGTVMSNNQHPPIPTPLLSPCSPIQGAKKIGKIRMKALQSTLKPSLNSHPGNFLPRDIIGQLWGENYHRSTNCMGERR